MTTQPSTRKPFYRRIKPVGWLALAVFAVLFFSLALLLLRPILSPGISLANALTPPPTWTPVLLTPTRTPVPSATPLPTGWTQQIGLNGQPYLAPPADVEQTVRTAFETVTGCFSVQDAKDAVLLKYDRASVCQKAQQIAPQYTRNLGDVVTVVSKLGPESITCSDKTTCAVSQAHLGIARFISYDSQVCRELGLPQTPCLNHNYDNYDLSKYFIWIVTFQMEGGTWKVTDWKLEKLPGPPPAF